MKLPDLINGSWERIRRDVEVQILAEMHPRPLIWLGLKFKSQGALHYFGDRWGKCIPMVLCSQHQALSILSVLFNSSRYKIKFTRHSNRRLHSIYS